MKRDPRLYLEDILQSIKAIEDYTEGITEEQFNTTQIVQDAVVRRLEIIGEAAKHLPREVKDQSPSIPWRRITGMRNRVIHEYFGILLERVWGVIQKDLPILKAEIEEVYKMLDQ